MSKQPHLWTIDRPAIPVLGSTKPFPVRRIYCVGRNYVDHIREMKEGDERDDPFFFQKPTDAIVQHGSAIPYPMATTDYQFEGELVVAIGEHDPTSDPIERIFGYAAGLDMTRRDRQKEAVAMSRPWEPGKSFDQSAPCGTITPRAEAGAVQEANLRLLVNAEPRQSTPLTLMIWRIAEIIERLSKDYHLKAGDLIYTGTPAGVAAVHPGDTIRVEIDNLQNLEVNISERTNHEAN